MNSHAIAIDKYMLPRKRISNCQLEGWATKMDSNSELPSAIIEPEIEIPTCLTPMTLQSTNSHSRIKNKSKNVFHISQCGSNAIKNIDMKKGRTFSIDIKKTKIKTPPVICQTIFNFNNIRSLSIRSDFDPIYPIVEDTINPKEIIYHKNDKLPVYTHLMKHFNVKPKYKSPNVISLQIANDHIALAPCGSLKSSAIKHKHYAISKFQIFKMPSPTSILTHKYENIIQKHKRLLYETKGVIGLSKFEWVKEQYSMATVTKLLSMHYEISEKFVRSLILKYYIIRYDKKLIKGNISDHELLKFARKGSNDFYCIKPHLDKHLQHKNEAQRKLIYECIVATVNKKINLNEFIELMLIVKYKRPPNKMIVGFLLQVLDPLFTGNLTKQLFHQRLKYFIRESISLQSIDNISVLYSELERCFNKDKDAVVFNINALCKVLYSYSSMSNKLYRIIVD